jgi:hypothetical protein
MLGVHKGVSVRDMLRAGDRRCIVAVARKLLQGKTVNRSFEQRLAMASVGG